MPTPTILSFFRPIRRRQVRGEDRAATEEKKDSTEVEGPKQRQLTKEVAREITQPSAGDDAAPARGDADARGDGERKKHTVDRSSSDSISEYEKKRLERVAENAAFLARLGMKSAQFALVSEIASSSTARDSQPKTRSAAKRKHAALAMEIDGEKGLRRSSRLRKLPAEGEDSTQQHAPPNDAEELDSAEVLDLFFDDSSVLRYTCQGSVTSTVSNDASGVAGPSTAGSLVGFEHDEQRDEQPLFDPKLKKIYAVDFSPFADNALFVAAGHQGYVSVYAARSSSLDAPGGERGPLLSFKAHKGWISSVSLTKSSLDGRRNLLLTSSNDALVKLWDLNQVTTPSASSVPRTVFQTDKLHNAGIFSMDVLLDEVATCSKDSTVAISQFRDDGSLHVALRYANQHDGVVKSVNFSRKSPRQVASGGNDRVLRVFDTNIHDRAVVEVRDAHSRAINSVQFHPTDENLLVSAGFDADMHLFDLRHPSVPLFTLRGHLVDAKQQSAIYHPVFVDGGCGLAAAAGAQCRHVSLYSVQDGRTVSRGAIPSRPDVLAVDPFADRLLIGSGGVFESYRFMRR